MLDSSSLQHPTSNWLLNYIQMASLQSWSKTEKLSRFWIWIIVECIALFQIACRDNTVHANWQKHKILNTFDPYLASMFLFKQAVSTAGNNVNNYSVFTRKHLLRFVWNARCQVQNSRTTWSLVYWSLVLSALLTCNIIRVDGAFDTNLTHTIEYGHNLSDLCN